MNAAKLIRRTQRRHRISRQEMLRSKKTKAPGLCHDFPADQESVGDQPHWFLTMSARIFAVPSMPNRLLSIMRSLWSKTLCQPGI